MGEFNSSRYGLVIYWCRSITRNGFRNDSVSLAWYSPCRNITRFGKGEEMRPVRMLAKFGLFLMLIAALGACAPVAPANTTGSSGAVAPANPVTAQTSSAIPEITIHAMNIRTISQARFSSGLVSLTLVNDGHEVHHAQFARLNDNVTMDQLMSTMQQGPEKALSLVTVAGGPGQIVPGQRQTVTVNLTPGNYVVLCFVSGEDNVPHLAKGMMSNIQVAAAPAAPLERRTLLCGTEVDRVLDSAGLLIWNAFKRQVGHAGLEGNQQRSGAT